MRQTAGVIERKTYREERMTGVIERKTYREERMTGLIERKTYRQNLTAPQNIPPRAQSPLPELKPAGRNIRRPAIHDPIKRSNAISGSRTAAAGSRGGANQKNHRADREERDSDTIQKAY